MKNQQYGICALCGEYKKLTYEHIPPKAAFNSSTVRSVTAEEIIGNNSRMPWEIDGLHYEQEQKGAGGYYLCEICNSNTGTWYGNDFCDFARKISFFLETTENAEEKSLVLQKVYPLRIIKQIASMFCSINSEIKSEEMKELREFVLNKERVGLNKFFSFRLYLTKSEMGRVAVITSLSYVDKSGKRMLDCMSEIAAYPLGYRLHFGTEPIENENVWDITFFADWEYNQPADLTIPLASVEINNVFPCDYRSKEEIQKWNKYETERI